jgi:hypothetical protein
MEQHLEESRMKRLALLFAMGSLELASQSYELRINRLAPHFQELPEVVVTNGDAPVVSGWTEQKGQAAEVALPFKEFSPSVSLRGLLELSQISGKGYLLYQGNSIPIEIKQNGIGFGMGMLAQHRSSGFGLEADLKGRLWNYSLTAPMVSNTSGPIAAAWVRLGVRWGLPRGVVRPFLTASSEWLLSSFASPNTTPRQGSLTRYLQEQGQGQMATRLQTLGIGIAF